MRKNSIILSLIFFIYLALVACGSKTGKHDTRFANDNLTASQILGDTNYLAMCYGGYRSNTRDSQPSVAQIKDDLKILHAIGIRLLRTYNTYYNEVNHLLQAITELKQEDADFNMYVMLGVWIDCENAWTDKTPVHEKENSVANMAEISCAVELANQYPQIVKMIAVGNEAMVKWATSYYVTPQIILKWVLHLQQLKKENKLPHELWITSSDNFASWGGGDSSYHVEALKQLYDAVDFVSIHTYPMHDTHYNPSFWKLNKQHESLSNEAKIDTLMMRAVEYAKTQYAHVVKYMKSIGVNKPIHIGETGWASASDGFYGNDGSRACDEYKAAKYYAWMRSWTNQARITCFYFEAFDEKWKDAKNPNGSENHFGLFTVEGKAKYALWNMVEQGLFNELSRDGNRIDKTYQGNTSELLKTVHLPNINNN